MIYNYRETIPTGRLMASLLQSYPVGTSTRVLNGCSDGFSETPFIPNLLISAHPPHVTFYLFTLFHIHGSLTKTHTLAVRRSSHVHNIHMQSCRN